jgi:hypothetical protein
MDPGDILGRTWALYGAHWRRLITVAAVVFVPLGAISVGLAQVGWPGILVADVLDIAAVFLVQGALVTTVEDVRDGRNDLTVAQIFGRAGERLPTLAVASILATIGILLGLVLLIVPGLVLLTWWLLIAPVVVLESRGVAESFGRSRRLVTGTGWSVFGIVVLTLLVLVAFTVTLELATLPLPRGLRGFLGTAIGNSISAPFVAVAWTLTYFVLRDREDAAAAATA